MNAIVFSADGRLETAVLSRPECGPGEVLLEVTACEVGSCDLAHIGTAQIPGHAVAGVVAETGLGVQRWRPGNRLALGSNVHCGVCHYCRHGMFNLCDQLRRIGKDLNGGLAEYILLTRDVMDHGIVSKVPDSLGLVDAALADSLSGALALHEDLAIKPLETVALVHCGAPGILHAQLLEALEASVIFVDDSQTLLNRAEKDLGVESTVNSATTDPVQEVVELTEGLGADVVITATRSPGVVQQSISMARKRGRVALMSGFHRGKLDVDVEKVHRREIRLEGSFSYQPGYHPRALDALAAGSVDCDKLITTYEIPEIARAMQELHDYAALSAVILPNGRKPS